ncbi:cytochrome P450 [Streptomyces sp. NPDC059783]|uniref:cytochrome P450 family protein n=1 Tax=Streptomyces sp. NPDC059783 TaxID=3346944 RepID=UPI00365EDF71
MSDVETDLYANADFLADPYPYYARMRAAGPVHSVRTDEYEHAWLVVGHEEGRAVLADPRFAKNWRTLPGQADSGSAAIKYNMLEMDGEDHTRLRKLISREFTPRRIEALRPRVRQITGELLDAMVPAGRADLVDALAFPLPMTVICELIGVPDLDREAFRAMSAAVVSTLGEKEDPDAFGTMGAYLAELIATKRRTPGEDLLSALIAARDDDLGRLSSDELIGMAFLLLVAGHETTVNLIGNGVRALLDHPDQLDALKADFGLLDAAVEEMLRYEGPVENATYRFARERVTVAGRVIEAGETVLVSLAGAGRDGARHPAPDTFDIRREPRGHLAFGHGAHFCIGAPLARMEGRIAIRALLERCPGLAPDPDGAAPEWVPGLLIRGARRLPVRW